MTLRQSYIMRKRLMAAYLKEVAKSDPVFASSAQKLLGLGDGGTAS